MSKAATPKKSSIAEQQNEEKSPAQRLLEVGLKVTCPRLLVLSLLHERKRWIRKRKGEEK